MTKFLKIIHHYNPMLLMLFFLYTDDLINHTDFADTVLRCAGE